MIIISQKIWAPAGGSAEFQRDSNDQNSKMENKDDLKEELSCFNAAIFVGRDFKQKFDRVPAVPLLSAGRSLPIIVKIQGTPFSQRHRSSCGPNRARPGFPLRNVAETKNEPSRT